MKKNIILPLLISALTISGCNSIKAPTFKTFSNVVNYYQFLDKLNDSDFDKFFLFKSSLVGSSYTAKVTEEENKAENVLLSKFYSSTENKYSFKYDHENERSFFNEKEEDVSTVDGADGIKQSATSLSASRQYQLYVDPTQELYKLEYLICIDKAQQVFYKVTDDGNAGELAGYKSMSGLLTFSIFVAFFPLSEEEAKQATKFYFDNEMFTIDMHFTTTYPTYDNELNKVSTVEEKIDRTFQVDLSKENKIDFRYSDLMVTTTKYEMSTGTHEMGEINIRTVKTYQTSNLEMKDVTINEIDVSSFAYREKDLGDL